MLMSLVKENTRLWTILGNKELLWVMIQTLTIVFMELMVIIVIIICNRLLLLLLFLLFLFLLFLFLLLFLLFFLLLFLLLSIADLIMLGLATHEPYFTILREEFKPNQPRPCEICNQYGMHRQAHCTVQYSCLRKVLFIFSLFVFVYNLFVCV